MENSRGKQNGMLWGLWLGLAVMGGCSVYYYPLFLLTMLAVPAVWAAMAFRTRPVMLVVAAALVFLFGYMMGYDLLSCLCILGAAAPAGCVLYVSQKERMGNFQSVLYVSLLLTFGQFLIFCVPDLAATGDPYASLRSYFAEIPALFEGGYALVNVLLLHAFNKRQKDMPLCPLGPYGTWSASYGYVMILGGASLLVTILTMATDTPMVSALSLLLYEMWTMPLLLTGANYLYAVLKRRLPQNRVGLLYGLVMGAGLVFLYQIFQMVLLLLGLVGVIRRRRAGKAQR